ncbi:MAG: hypothetical protein ABIW16_03925 [Sphingomicrobium sp.]
MEVPVTVVSVRELNANISKTLARVEAGETLDIAKNGKIIAEIRPKPKMADAAWRRAYEGSVAFLHQGIELNVGKVTEADKYGDVEL